MRVFATGWSDGYDGPGRRWVVYLKGCNFRCRWCANPEGIDPGRQMLFYPNRGSAPSCACPNGAVRPSSGPVPPSLNRSQCDLCATHDCVRRWKHPAFELAGQDLTVHDIVTQVRRSALLFGNDGGVTFGGGEATLQAKELLEALERLSASGVHTAVETNAATPVFRNLFDCAGLVLADLKCVSADIHREWTGADNAVVLENLAWAAAGGRSFWVRIPLVTGLNDRSDEQEAMARFLGELRTMRHGLTVELLPMHHLGKPKYAALGLEYPMEDVPVPSPQAVAAFRERLQKEGIDARIAPRH